MSILVGWLVFVFVIDLLGFGFVGVFLLGLLGGDNIRVLEMTFCFCGV